MGRRNCVYSTDNFCCCEVNIRHDTAAAKMHQLLYRSLAGVQGMWKQVHARTAFGRLISISAVPGLWP